MFTPMAEIARQFRLSNVPALEPRYNIAPTQFIATIRADEAGERSVNMLRWGLVPHWAKDVSIGNRLINARSETVAEKPAFRQAFAKRHCLVLASGFYEWAQTSEGKRPFYCAPETGECLALAGLWERWHAEETVLESCVIITTRANGALARIHERMPVILSRGAQDLWLDRDASKEEQLALLQPAPDDLLHLHQVDRAVNNPRNEGADLVEAVMNSKS